MGRIARVSPVLDPATRTAPIEVEIANPSYRLKPGMYARVGITLDTTKDALVVPANALVDLGGRRGVFQPLSETAVFRAVQVGNEQGQLVEILGGLTEGQEVITTGAGQLRDGDRIVIAGGRGGRGRGRTGGGTGPDSASARPGGETPTRGGDTSASATDGAGPSATGARSGGQFSREGGQFSGRRGRRGDSGSATAPAGDVSPAAATPPSTQQ